MDSEVEFSTLHLFGKIILRVTDSMNIRSRAPRKYDNEVYFHMWDGTVYRMHHIQDCCECVRLVDVCGDWADLTEAQIIQAEERVSDACDNDVMDDSGTWTFYDLQTNKGCVTLRWLGESNGYYSEHVNFERVK